MKIARITGLTVGLASLVATALPAQLVNLGPGSFSPLAPTITFSEYALGTINPSYNFTDVLGLGDVEVNFAGAFMGQTVTGGNPVTLTGLPTGPLALNSAVETIITVDGAIPTSPVLSGQPLFNGPIAILFSKPVAAVGLSGGFFDAVGGTSIAAYGTNGAFLGSITNSQTGVEFYGLRTAFGTNDIAGVAFYITGDEPAGFGIDNVMFGSVRQLQTVPEPSTVLLMASGIAFLGIGGVVRRRRQG